MLGALVRVAYVVLGYVIHNAAVVSHTYMQPLERSAAHVYFDRLSCADFCFFDIFISSSSGGQNQRTTKYFQKYTCTQSHTWYQVLRRAHVQERCRRSMKPTFFAGTTVVRAPPFDILPLFWDVAIFTNTAKTITNSCYCCLYALQKQNKAFVCYCCCMDLLTPISLLLQTNIVDILSHLSALLSLQLPCHVIYHAYCNTHPPCGL